VDSEEWIAAFAAELGVSAPTSEEVQELLALAGTAAHASERIAAPISCWIAARSDLTPGEASELARRLARAAGEQ
jgi:Domain of unknown function (DUF6457)